MCCIFTRTALTRLSSPSQAVGYGSVAATAGTPQFVRWQTLRNLSVGNIILSVAG